MNWRNYLIHFGLNFTKSNIINNLRDITNISKFSSNDIEKYQDNKLKNLLMHAYLNVPYYNKILTESGVIKDGEVNLDNFKKIPFLTKDIIRKQGNEIYSRDFKSRKTYINTSGGSTGEPVKLLQDKYYKDWNFATKLYFFNSLFSKKIGEPEINLWGSERDIYKNSLDFKEKCINFIYNRKFLNAFTVDDTKLNMFVHEINKHKPISMWVYVESIQMLAKFIDENNLKIHSPKFIISTAGTLYPEIRTHIEETFKCPVYNQYGSREVGPIAIECQEKNGLHDFFWMNYLEIIDSRIIVTSLNNYSMPLIRYDIGDIGIESDFNLCKCGLNNLKLAKVLGREISHFKTKDGKIIHGQYLIHQFYFKTWVKKFQIIQTDYDNITCKVVLCGQKNKDEMNIIVERIKMVMGNTCDVKWEFVDDILNLKSGKFLYTISEVSYNEA